MNPFEILEVPADATPEDIRAAYHRLAKQWHPDRFMGEEKARAEEKFRSVAEAFHALKDPAKRQAFAAQVPKASSKAPSSASAAPTNAEPFPKSASPSERKPEDWAAEARKVYEDGGLDQAKGLIQFAIRLDGSKADFHIFFADLLEESGDKRGAVKALEAAHKLRPKDADLLIRLADHFSTLGLQARATRLMDEAKTIAPNHKRFKVAAEGKVQAAGMVNPPGEGLLDQVKGVLNRWLKKG
jgi:curved DNA-binding protein CbpA